MQVMLTERAGQATKGKGMTDDVIIKRSLDEPDCFAEIFERHAGEIARYVHARLGPDLAEDVTESPATTGRRPGPTRTTRRRRTPPQRR